MKIEDELTKNHREKDSELITGFMPQLLNADGTPHRLCPVQSYENYINALNEECNFLWQKVNINKFKKGQVPYFDNVQVGKNPHSTFMSDLSEKIGLDQRYTNHSIRVTGVTNLTCGHYTPHQIMSITGHKSIQSLSIYQRVKDDEKMMMGMSLMYSLLWPCDVQKVTNECNPVFEIEENPDVNQQAIPVLPPPVQNKTELNKTVAVPNQTISNVTELSETAVVPYISPQENAQQDNHNFDILELLSDGADADLLITATQIENQISAVSTTTTTSMSSIVKKSSLNRPIQATGSNMSGWKFGNIGTLNIHIHHK